MAEAKTKKQLAREELAYRRRKEAATRSLHEFVRQAWHVMEPEVPFLDNWHIKGICEHLEAVADGRIKNLLVNVPPGTCKSYLTCVFWPAWVWTTRPGKRFMLSSYSEDLSMRDSLRTRKLLGSEWYQERWPLAFSESQDTKGKFENVEGGWRMIGSVTGKGTGEHPDYLVADDPHNVLQAESDADRQTVTRWIEGVLLTRGLVRDVGRVLIMQRLHMQDASGVVLEKGGWTHICLPMRYEAPEWKVVNNKPQLGQPRMKPTPLGWTDPRTEDGELLWPEAYPEDKVRTLEVNLGLYGTAGQLQQRPSPRGGGTFRREWFEVLASAPSCLRMVRYWDKAGTKGGSGAESAGVLVGEYEDAAAALPALRLKYVVLDAVVFRKAAAEREAVIKQTAALDRQNYPGNIVETWVEQEPGSGGKESAESTVGNLAGFVCKIERVTGAKEVRAEPLASQASVGKVKVVAASWTGQFLDELEHFPNGRLKDMVDAAGGAFNKMFEPQGSWSAKDLPPVVRREDPDDLELDTREAFEADLSV